jgi:hypothetical protein
MDKISLYDVLGTVPDPRSKHGRRHDLRLMLTLVIMSNLSGYNGYRAIGEFIVNNRHELSDAFKPKNGRLPSFDAIRRLLCALDFAELNRAFYTWAKQFVDFKRNHTVSVDGKSLASTLSSPNGGEQKFIALVSVFDSARRLSLTQSAYGNADKSEIVVVDDLLKTLDLKGALVTADALHCQKKRSTPFANKAETI